MRAKQKFSQHHCAFFLMFCATAMLLATVAHSEATQDSGGVEYILPELDQAPRTAFLMTVVLLSPFDPIAQSAPARGASSTESIPQSSIDQASSRNDAMSNEISDTIKALDIAGLDYALPLRRYEVEKRSLNGCSDPSQACDSAHGIMLGTQIIEFSAARSLCDGLTSQNKFCLVMPPR